MADRGLAAPRAACASAQGHLLARHGEIGPPGWPPRPGNLRCLFRVLQPVPDSMTGLHHIPRSARTAIRRPVICAPTCTTVLASTVPTPWMARREVPHGDPGDRHRDGAKKEREGNGREPEKTSNERYASGNPPHASAHLRLLGTSGKSSQCSRKHDPIAGHRPVPTIAGKVRRPGAPAVVIVPPDGTPWSTIVRWVPKAEAGEDLTFSRGRPTPSEDAPNHPRHRTQTQQKD